ncbi:SUR7/PalI family-domain-containing protein [Bombardia bombarda]|uniref:SUR7/PalI family-domain-containing protein n=1 Tax=Bombardia bombarda TaxID=252184 RepID=A0AA39WCM7_9PEZI|nr:SUR7/PalI family-domain-containing protein [Bombardia bombarda]
MLRPATPLSVLLFSAFCLLLLAVLSTPIIKAVPLCSFGGDDFGVFGYCTSTGCSPIEIGYDARIIKSEDPSDFNLSPQTRSTLSALLIIHPVAAFLTLAMFVLAVIAHLRSPSHSARYLLMVFIVSIVNFVVCLLAFLIDILLFVPHLAWGSYIVLAATILVAISGLVSCAMRRTVVGKKARQKRIAANAEMSGENYYNRQNQQTAAVSPVHAAQPTVPMISGANGRPDTLPEFASFEKKDDQSSDEGIPLTLMTPADRSSNTLTSDPALTPKGNMPLRSLSNTLLSRDQYGNALPPQDGYAAVRRDPSMERMNMRGRGGMPPGPAGYRGRGGGYAGPGRGGYYGYASAPPPNGRGGYGGPQGRGGYGPPPGNRGGYGPPPRGSGGLAMRRGRTFPPPSYHSAPGPYDRRPSPGAAAAYGPGPYGARQPSPGPPSASGYMNQSTPSVATERYDAYTPGMDGLARAESPPPLPGIDDGIPTREAVEMDNSNLARTQTPRPQGYGPYGIRDSDVDVAGMLAMQQARMSTGDRDSRYSSEESTYVPPRQAWNQGPVRNSPGVPSPVYAPGRTTDMPVSRRSPAPPRQQPAPSGGGDGYYEDVDPRFDDVPILRRLTPPPTPLPSTDSYEDIPQGARSPAESERSSFTSISQRGINPRWNQAPPPAMLGGYGGNVRGRRPVNNNQQADMLFNSNPYFQLPSRGSPPRKKGGSAMVSESAYPAGPL